MSFHTGYLLSRACIGSMLGFLWAPMQRRPLPTSSTGTMKQGYMHGRFIDDLCLIHPRSWPQGCMIIYAAGVTPLICPLKCSILTNNEVLTFLMCSSFPFVVKCAIVLILSKPTLVCTCLGAGIIPCVHKLGWIKGERARYLWTNSHEVYFDIVYDRLKSCLIRLHYPRCACPPPPPPCLGIGNV